MKKDKSVKVRCKVCVNENQSFCDANNIKVRINKPRHCSKFVYDVDKIQVKTKLPSTYIKGGNFKEFRNRIIAEIVAAEEAKRGEEAPDCLSQFRSTSELTGEASKAK